MGVTTKEQVFQIMGNYYGNAYWREAIRNGYSEESLFMGVKSIIRMVIV